LEEDEESILPDLSAVLALDGADRILRDLSAVLALDGADRIPPDLSAALALAVAINPDFCASQTYGTPASDNNTKS